MAQANPPLPWRAGSWGIHLRHMVRLCCHSEVVTGKAFLTSSSPFIKIENEAVLAFKAYEEFTVEMEESQMGFVRSVKRVCSSRT